MSRVAARQREFPHLPGSPEVNCRELLVWADVYQRLGWQPIPLRITFQGEKKILDFSGFKWGELREHPLTWHQTEALFRAAGSRANAIAIVLQPGHYVGDPDSADATAVMVACSVDGCRATTLRGSHYHFQGPVDLADSKVTLAPGLELLAAGIVIMPPSLGLYKWAVMPNGELPQLPPFPLALARTWRNAAGKRKAATPCPPEKHYLGVLEHLLPSVLGPRETVLVDMYAVALPYPTPCRRPPDDLSAYHHRAPSCSASGHLLTAIIRRREEPR